MAKAIVKCLICGVTFDRNSEEFCQKGRRYAHKECFDREQEKRSQEERDKDSLEEYIKKLFNEDYISARIRQQINRMREQYDFSYTGILKSLIFFFEVRGNSIEKANGGIGIVPYVYKDAYNYYYNLHLAQQKNEDKKIEDFVQKSRQVVISPPKRQPKTIKLFNLEEE